MQLASTIFLSTTNTDTLCCRGWSGSLYRFHLASRSWEWLACGPSPRAGHAGDRTHDLWVIFGGAGNSEKFNDVLAYEFKTNKWKTLHSGHRPDIQYYIMRDPSESGLITNFKGELLPEPRSGHSCTKIKCLKNRASFFVYGGIGMLNTPLNDAWILEISDYGLEVTWTPYTLAYDHGHVRCLHAGDFKIQQLK